MDQAHHTRPRAKFSAWFVGVVGVAVLAVLADSVVEIRAERRARGGGAEPGEAGAEVGVESTRAFEVTEPMEVPSTAALLPEVLSADDAAFGHGVWFVLDATAARVHRVSSSGALLGSFGRRGQGPGEFGGRLAAIAVHGDSVAVLEFAGRRLHLFDPEGEPVADRLLRLDDCAVPAASGIVSSPLGLLMLVLCTQPDLRQEARVILETRDGFMRTLATQGSDPEGPAVLGGSMWHTLAAHPSGFVFGANIDECLGVHDLQGDVLESVCHDWMDPVPTPDELVRATREQLAALPNVRWELPDAFHPFFGLFVTADNEWIYRVAASDQPESYVLASRDRDGQRLPVPRARYVFVHEGSALVGWEDLQGTRIDIHPLEGR